MSFGQGGSLVVRTASFGASHCFSRAAQREFPPPQHASQPASPLDASSSLVRRAASGFFGQDKGSAAHAGAPSPQTKRDPGAARTALPPRASMSQASSPSCSASCHLPRHSSLKEQQQQQQPCSASSSLAAPLHWEHAPGPAAIVTTDTTAVAMVEAAEGDAGEQLPAPASPWADVPDDVLRTILSNMPPAYVRVCSHLLTG